jgi:ATP-dependent helicase/nuclease subunit A
MAKDFDPTDAQNAAIHEAGRSVVVSAGAGSGKTAVLAERCAFLVAGHDPPCDVKELLVVTFTEAAAAQMRLRIEESLRRQLSRAGGGRRLEEQIALLDTASISTIHAFCRRVLNRYFTAADLDPQAPLLDEHEAQILRRETAHAALDRLAARDDREGRAVLDLLAAYAGTREDWLLEIVLDVDAFLTSVTDPAAWIAACLERMETPSGGALPGFWSDRFFASLSGELNEQLRTVEAALREIGQRSHPLSQGFEACVGEYGRAVSGWLKKLGDDPAGQVLESACKEIGEYKFPGIPPRPRNRSQWPLNEQDALERSKLIAEDIREVLFKSRLQGGFGRFTIAGAAEGIVRTRGHLGTLVSLVTAVRKEFQAAKRELGVVDFGDLERMTLDLLRDDSTGAAARLRDQYRYVLVDEFQDVNPVQAEILRRISREDDPTRPANLFTVGDVKQSIYRFRLAEPRLFLDRQEKFSTPDDRGARVDLLENFRSTTGVIDAVNAIFERLMAPDLGGIAYDAHARLKAQSSPPENPAGPAMELHLLDGLGRASENEEGGGDEHDDAGAADWEQIEREAYVIAERIREKRAAGRAYREMVILLRSMQPRAGLLVRTLARLGVPVFADAAGALFESLEAMDVMAVLSLLDNLQQDIPLATLLRGPLMGPPLTDDELGEIVASARAVDPSVPFHVAAARYAEAGRRDELARRLRQVYERLDAWRRRVRRRPLADVLSEIYEESGYLAFVSGLREGPQRRANLLRLHEYARQFGAFHRQGLHRFLRFLEALQQTEQDLEPGSVSSASQDAVRVMTIHRSKGLEFPVVIVGELGKRINFADARGNVLYDRTLGLAMQAVDLDRRITWPTIPHRLVAQAARNECLAEELRVLYVALTRAREELIGVGTGDLAALDAARRRWPGHAGPLPLLQRQSATSVLDWVVAAMGCQAEGTVAFDEPPSPRSIFSIRTYRAADMTTWVMDRPLSRQGQWLRDRLASLQAVPSQTVPGVAAATAEAVRRRLTTPYSAASLTRVPSVAAASVLKRRWNEMGDDEEPLGPAVSTPAAGAAARSYHFAPPGFSRAIADPTQRGTWTHEFLERVDLARPCDEKDLREQADRQVADGRLDAGQAGQIDLSAIAWFFSTELGRRLRLRSRRVLREWPFVLGVDPRRYDAAARPMHEDDVMLVRGMIDCLFDTGDGWEVLDYKTDAVSGEALKQRAGEYRGQVEIYAAAVEACWKTPVAGRWLVFLSARSVVNLLE